MKAEPVAPHGKKAADPAGSANQPWRSKYTPDAARQYQVHTERKDRDEKRLVERAFAQIPSGTVLDLPCGGGRMSLLLASKGYTVTASDYSEAMLRIAKENAEAARLPIDVVRGDIQHLEFADRSFDTVFSFRLFHHFPGAEIRARVVSQLCRVSRKRVVISYFSPWAFTSFKRALQTKYLGYSQKKFATSLGELGGYFSEHGFKLRSNFARMPLLHTLHLAVFERE